MKLAARCLQLDVGNSGAKWRLLEHGGVTARGTYRRDDPTSRDALLNCTQQLQQVWVSSVAEAAAQAELTRLLFERWGVAPWYASSRARTGDLHNSYARPERMGVDRWLAMLAARQRARERACVVDAGSALTIDLISASGQHEGGYIIPGPQLMERSLLLDTDRVRFAGETVGAALVPGSSTATAVRHGIALAQAGAVSLALDRAGEPAPRVFFFGGAGATLQQLLGRGGELVPDLVFEGLEVLAASA